MSLSAEQIHRQLLAKMDEVEPNKSHLAVTKPAMEFGMKHGEHGPAGLGINDEWRLQDDTGYTVLLTYESYDTSKTFEMKPDVNKVGLQLLGPDGKILANRLEVYYD